MKARAKAKATAKRMTRIGATLLLALCCHKVASADAGAAAAQASPAPSADQIAQLARQLTPRQAIRGHFEQTRQLPFLQQPFRSSGQFSLAASGRLVWQVEEPAPSRMEVDASGVQLDGNSVDDHGIGQLLSRLMLSFLSGDLSGLQRHFEVTGLQPGPPWQLELRARGRLQQAIAGLSLDGGEYLQSIRIHEADGSSTLIQLTAIDAGED
ncbi:outer membrane lipoprotein carrier protein LolA [Parahaliea mediterranea]|uniref:outer membrane lipoprotein carrier protein LolA n=1 Tax=Parahaliea mediterranea TaxID=651086 RepID=UPI0013004561|nr:outer membrane lipoprotein carrier protein LolA [Parahaliea mediterranea]